MESKDKIRNYIEENLIVFDEDATFTDEDNIFKMGFVNSLFAMKLLTFIESNFDIIVENDEMEIANFSSVNNILNFISKKKEA